MLKKMMVICVVMGALLAGCGKSPMDSLKSDDPNDDVSSSFWEQEHLNNTALWKEGVEYCKSHVNKENCRNLRAEALNRHGSTKMMGYGHSGDVINVYGTNVSNKNSG